jgi:hypothetical protein
MNTDWTPYVVLLLAIIGVAWGVRDFRRINLKAGLRPPAPTPRPEPVEIIDWQEAWRDVGPTPSWEEVRRG